MKKVYYATTEQDKIKLVKAIKKEYSNISCIVDISINKVINDGKILYKITLSISDCS